MDNPIVTKAELTDTSANTDAERTQVQPAWNATAAAFPEEALLQELFEVQAGRTPERIALKAGAGSLSYAELDAVRQPHGAGTASTRLGRGHLVGLCVERGPEMLTALLGILKAGAAYVPLGPSFPQERLRFMAKDAELALLVSSEALTGPFGLPRERQLLLDADAASIAAAPAPLRPAPTSPDDIPIIFPCHRLPACPKSTPTAVSSALSTGGRA